MKLTDFATGGVGWGGVGWGGVGWGLHACTGWSAVAHADRSPPWLASPIGISKCWQVAPTPRPWLPVAAGVRYMEFSEAVARSAASGRAVALPLLD